MKNSLGFPTSTWMSHTFGGRRRKTITVGGGGGHLCHQGLNVPGLVALSVQQEVVRGAVAARSHLVSTQPQPLSPDYQHEEAVGVTVLLLFGHFPAKTNYTGTGDYVLLPFHQIHSLAGQVSMDVHLETWDRFTVLSRPLLTNSL